ncbi:rCG43905 [Rattus norvegicus]|uniref:RCG43905 n=1 Tax=Rattus norvegicus TaxID=10116 RepID=A6J7J0_RAT|nr:rCG43905 [Rattus norvegicus]
MQAIHRNSKECMWNLHLIVFLMRGYLLGASSKKNKD